jgi:hypothetical protein
MKTFTLGYFYAYIKSLDCKKTLWSGQFKTEALAWKALEAQYKLRCWNLEDPPCNSGIEEIDED